MKTILHQAGVRTFTFLFDFQLMVKIGPYHSAKMSLPSLPALSAKEKAKLWLENRKSIAPKRHQGKHEVPGSRPKVLNNYYRYEHFLFVEDFM